MNELIDNFKVVKLHVGCGTVYMDGWINIDNNSDNNIKNIDINTDLRNGLPFADNSVDFIFNEHFLEHLTWDEGLNVVKEFLRVLKPTGVLRIAMPDLADTVNIYMNKNWKTDYKEYFEKYGLTHIKTAAENININFRAWGHKHLYDFEELERLLKGAGFTDIRRRFFHESTYEDLRGLETRNESTLVAEAIKDSVCVPLVTVICCTYNHEAYIAEALESIVVQKTDFKFEVLVSDDASTDNTAEILREYEKKYTYIIKVIYRKKNLGAIINGLHTLNDARSKYVVINEGDDYFNDPYKLQKQVDFLEKHPDCSICFHPVNVLFQDGSKPSEIFPSPQFRFNKTKFSLEDLLKHNFIQTNSAMYRWLYTTENLLDVFPKSILPGDYYLHLLHAQKGSIGFLDEIMSVYRRHEGGIFWEAQTPEKLHSRYCTEIFSFYYEIFKNIAVNPESYYINTLVPVFNTLVSSLEKCGNPEKLAGILEKYSGFVAGQKWELLHEIHKPKLKLKHKIKHKIKHKLRTYKIVRSMYHVYKKWFFRSL